VWLWHWLGNSQRSSPDNYNCARSSPPLSYHPHHSVLSRYRICCVPDATPCLKDMNSLHSESTSVRQDCRVSQYKATVNHTNMQRTLIHRWPPKTYKNPKMFFMMHVNTVHSLVLRLGRAAVPKSKAGYFRADWSNWARWDAWHQRWFSWVKRTESELPSLRHSCSLATLTGTARQPLISVIRSLIYLSIYLCLSADFCRCKRLQQPDNLLPPSVLYLPTAYGQIRGKVIQNQSYKMM